MRPRFTRRAAAIVLAATALVASLTACRVEQGAAVFVGDVRITEEQVDQYVDSLPPRLEVPPVGFRALTVDALAVVELGRQVAASEHLEPNDSDGNFMEYYWTRQGLPADDQFVALISEAESYRAMLVKGTTQADPTDTDVAETLELVTRTSGAVVDEAFVRSLLTSDTGRQVVGQRHRLAELVDEYDITANPRYGDTFIVVARDNQFQPLTTVPLPN